MTRLIVATVFLLFLFSQVSCKVLKKRGKAANQTAVCSGTDMKGSGITQEGFELIWQDNARNNSASMYQVNAESMVFGEGVLYYITGPKEPEGGSFSQIKALDLKTRKLKWCKKFVTHHFTKIDIENNLVVITGQQGFGDMFDGYSFVFALHAGTGELAWKTKIDRQPYGGGVFDMAVRDNSVLVLCVRENEDRLSKFELLDLNLQNGEVKNTYPLERKFPTDSGIFEAPFFLTSTNPETLKKELVISDGNLIIIGNEWISKQIESVSTSREVNVVLAVSLNTGKIVWQYNDNYVLFNSIAGWNVPDGNLILYFVKPLNAAGNTGLDIETGKEVPAEPGNITAIFNKYRPQRSGYEVNFLNVSQKQADYKIRYFDEDVFVFEKLK